ncbi:preprotein translocase subunit SecG [Bdellovibrio bacteriovorus]|uniref:Protein-export membrane protein SecG n=1 Tax=Bdellovibrio bacteriovorus TaxID=959 RepID=A0A162FWJ2_BDEBC|nr:preprotein translocase subunit SecG [Bdellovibrio bacteriovorus]KYG62632.1 preprotein translocase subunit SecG [Bdellovibrio bacteriovorus]
MTTFIGILHIIVALVLIVLVLIQDSKSDGALGMGGASGSNSLLGATGAQSLAGKMTVWAAILFAVSCLTLSILTSSKTKSVVDSLPLPTAPAAAPATTETNGAAAVPAETPAATATPAASPAATPAASPAQ